MGTSCVPGRSASWTATCTPEEPPPSPPLTRSIRPRPEFLSVPERWAQRDDFEDLVFGGALLLATTHADQARWSYRSGFFGPAERILLAEGHERRTRPAVIRQFAPSGPLRLQGMTARPRLPTGEGRVKPVRCTWVPPATNSCRPARILTGSPCRGQSAPSRTRSLPPRFDNSLPLD